VSTPALEIAPALSGDAEWCAALMARSEPWTTLGRTLDLCREPFSRAGYELFLARAEGRPLGFALCHPRGAMSSPYLTTIAVDVEARGRGVGGALLRFVEDHYRPQARHLFLCCSSFNTRAQALYLRAGYQRIAELEDYVIDGASELLFQKRL
jgi:ribosomal protein S18 acetylase RimI-like enzyme